jgi:cell division protein FtsI/penicillin-binding protein 2
MRLARLSSIAVVAVLTTTGLAACGGGSKGPDLASLQTALVSGDFSQVPLATPASGASDATTDYAAITKGLDGLKPTVTVGSPAVTGSTATAPVHWSWPLAGGSWSYDTTVTATKSGGDWGVDWSPAIVESSLAAGDTLSLHTVAATRADIVGAGGSHLVTDRAVTVFGIDKSKVTAAQAATSATALAQLVGVDAKSFAGRVASAGAQQFVDAITYRRDEAPSIATKLAKIPGAVALEQQLPLAPYKGFAAPLLGDVGPVTADLVKAHPGIYHVGDVAGLSGLEERYDTQLRGTPGTAIDLVGKDGSTKMLYEAKPKDGTPLQVTLDEHLQSLAESLLSKIGPASALVALRPSTGAILAAANGPGANGNNLATYGQFPPGSTFKMFDSLALLRKGLTPDSSVQCTPSVTVDGKVFKNDSWYPSSALGTVPLKTAVAQSCNTAMINARAKLTDVASAAATLGFGVDHDTGFPAYFGQVPKPASETEQAADLIGQGKVLASPLVMATAMASIEAGHTVVPSLVPSVKTPVPSSVTPLTKSEDAQLKTIFRQVVLTGTGSALRDVPGAPVIAKTGTAEFGQTGKTTTHAWMVAAQGDLAVAVFVDTGQTGAGTAGPIVEQFLRQAD